jgi:glycerol-3-phosphate dehydrogenase
MSASLNAAQRARDLDVLSTSTVDVLVVGGGITGAGVALDAASRGLTVAMVEKHDLSFGTSRWSSKLVHGGLRYLAHGDVHLAWESARERAALIATIAPHLVHPLPFVIPLNDAVPGALGRLAWMGYEAGDVLRMMSGTSRWVLPRPRRLSVAETLRYIPTVNLAHLRGGLLSWDGQLEDDARLVIAVARTAARYGARVITYAGASKLRGDGATVVDRRSGQTVELKARAVVNATGVWVPELEPEIALRPSKGAHLVLSGAALGYPRAALTVPVPGETNRFVFAMPQPDGLVYLGLTDDPITGPVPDVPFADEAEETFLLDVVSRALAVPVTPQDVVGSFAGLRPLAATGAGRTADLSRNHVVHRGGDGVVSVYGGKLTTYRKMAQDAVDTLARGPAGLPAGPSPTRTLPLVGAAPPAELAEVAAPARLVRRYGTEAGLVASMAEEDPSLLAPLAPGIPVLGVELAFGVRHEGALTVDDLLARRTRLALAAEQAERARPAAERILERWVPATLV